MFLFSVSLFNFLSSPYNQSLISLLLKKLHLEDDIDEDDDEGVGKVEYQPHSYRLDVRGGGQTGRY